MNRQLRNRQLSNALVGFDQFFNAINNEITGSGGNFPPHNILKIDDANYRISLAVAGFATDEVEITHHGDRLIVKGKKSEEDETAKYLHRGISTRSFSRTFVLSENTKPKDATFENGLLHIDLEHIIPEEKKPRTVKIRTH